MALDLNQYNIYVFLPSITRLSLCYGIYKGCVHPCFSKIYDLFALSFLVCYFVIEIIYKIKVSEDMVLNHRVKEDIVCKHPRSRGP